MKKLDQQLRALSDPQLFALANAANREVARRLEIKNADRKLRKHLVRQIEAFAKRQDISKAAAIRTLRTSHKWSPLMSGYSDAYLRKLCTVSYKKRSHMSIAKKFF